MDFKVVTNSYEVAACLYCKVTLLLLKPAQIPFKIDSHKRKGVSIAKDEVSQ